MARINGLESPLFSSASLPNSARLAGTSGSTPPSKRSCLAFLLFFSIQIMNAIAIKAMEFRL